MNPFTDQPFPGNIIPSSMISQAAGVFNKYIPAPNTNTAGVNLVASPKTERDDDQFTTRIDASLGPKDTLFGREVWYNSTFVTPGIAAYYGETAPYRGQTFALQETHSLSPSAINTLMLGFNRGVNLVSWQNTPGNVVAEMGIKNLGTQSSLFGLPDIIMSGFSNLGGFPFQGGGIDNVYQVSDELSLTHGKHAMSLGTDIRRTQFQAPATSFANGIYEFLGNYTGNPIGDYLLGTTVFAEALQGLDINNWRSTEWAFYAQDNFRVTPRFTLNLGLRYEYDQPIYEIDGKEGYFDSNLQKIVVRVPSNYSTFPIPSSEISYNPGFQKGIWSPQYDQFQPRFGLAYQLPHNSVIRGGYGIFYAKTEGNQLQGKANIPPLTFLQSLTGSLTTPNVLMSNLFPSPAEAAQGILSPFSVNPHDRRPYVQEWNFGVQHRFGNNTLAEVDYVGSRGTHLVERINMNQATTPSATIPLQERRPLPNWGDIVTFNYGESSNYNALQATLEKRLSNDMSFTASYTWSHSLDTSSADDVGAASSHQNMYDIQADYGNSIFNVPQEFVLSYTYVLPFGRGRHFLSGVGPGLDRLVGGWQVNGITTFAEGISDNVIVTGDRANTGGDSLERADQVSGCTGNGNLPRGQRTVARYFNTNCFAVTPLGTYGNTGRNILQVPGVNNWDVSLFKNTPITEKLQMQLRGEFFNAWNHAQFGEPVLNVQSPTFGRVLSANAAREIQVAVKFLW